MEKEDTDKNTERREEKQGKETENIRVDRKEVDRTS